MAYIHVKRIGNQKYYTLRISVRKGNNVITKDLANLGNDISKINIKDLERRFHKEVRSSYHLIKRFLDSNYYLEKAKKKKLKRDPFFSKEQIDEIEAVNIHYKNKFLKLDKLTQEEAFENFILNFAVNSTSIEGNTITLKEAYKLFNENLTPKNHTLREVYDLTNTKKVIERLRREKPTMDLNLIIKIHDDLLENIDKRIGLRSGDIKILGQPFKPSPARYVKADLNLLLNWYKKNKDKIPPLALVIFFHHKFEKIHPFFDGNGRTGRVIMNYILSLENYPPFVISRRFRKEYIQVMGDADSALKKSLLSTEPGHYQKLLDFIHSQFTSSYWDVFLT